MGRSLGALGRLIPCGWLLVVQWLLLLLLVLAVTPVPAAQVQPYRTPPPRGYCTQIWRALSPKSRCFTHLVEPASGQSQSTVTPTGLTAPAARPHAHQAHSLIYVRLETLGDQIGELVTRPINERLLEGLFGVLFEGAWPDVAKTRGSNNNTEAHQQKTHLTDEIRAQIMVESMADNSTGSQNRCKEALERLLCRLVYPSCHFRRAEVSALVRAPCREDCRLASELFCPNVNWPKLNLLIGWAVNASLQASLGALDLEVAGEEVTPRRPEMSQNNRPSPPSSASNPPPASETHQRQNHRPIQLDAESSHPNSTQQQQQQQHPLQQPYNFSNPQHSNFDSNPSPPPPVSRHSRPPGMSLHFYWPHEHSLASCHQLPALGPPLFAPAAAETARLVGHLKWGGLASSCSSAGLARWAGQLSAGSNTTTTTTTTTACNKAHYSGRLNVTQTGLKCQPWASQEPHRHSGAVLLLEHMRDAHNFCRNPGLMEQRPWCYTQNPAVRWQFCDTPPDGRP